MVSAAWLWNLGGSGGAQPLVTTGATGYALTSGTGTILQWTAPNDGKLHFACIACAYGSSSSAAGATIQWQIVNTSQSIIGYSNTAIASSHTFIPVLFDPWPVPPGYSVQLVQLAGLTAGSATVYASIYVS